jgi:hypothetical protein
VGEAEFYRVWKSCGRVADALWTACRSRTIFRQFAPEIMQLPHRGADSCLVSLARLSRVDQYCGGVKKVRFEETINGRQYIIEVSAVDANRWRAEILRRGGHTALMPFYGATALEAAAQLSQWLQRAAAAQ